MDLITSLILEEHREYLSDPVRTAAYDRAIRETVKPGHVVLDLASGTGILGLMACRAGAKRVFAVDRGPIIELAKQVCRKNGFEDRFTFIKGHSTKISLPEPVDVVLADQMGPFGFEGGVLDLFADAKERLLKPGGVMIPSGIDFHVAPTERPDIRTQIESWEQESAGFSFLPFRDTAVNAPYFGYGRAEDLLGRDSSAFTLDLSAPRPRQITMDFRIPIERKGTLHGLAGWFTARLSPGARMTNSPLSDEAIRRKTVFLPIDRAVPVSPKQVVLAQVRIVSLDAILSWSVRIMEAGDSAAETNATEFEHTSFRTLILTPDDLRKTRPDFTPTLTAWGSAELDALKLCEARRPLEEIQSELSRRFPDLFPTPRQTAEFVGRIMRDHCS